MFSVVFFYSRGGVMPGDGKMERLNSDTVIIVLELDAPAM